MDDTDESERIAMNRRERDRLKVLHGVRQGERAQKEAARLMRLTTRQAAARPEVDLGGGFAPPGPSSQRAELGN
jgi:hypothetical protein